MASNRQQQAVALLRACADEAGCNNSKLLEILYDDPIKRGGDALPVYGDELGSFDKRTLLPTEASLESAMNTPLMTCTCRLCQPIQVEKGGSKESLIWDANRTRDHAILVLCGCLFIARRSAFTGLDSLQEFVYKCYSSQKEDHLNMFSGIAKQPLKCHFSPHNTDPIVWRRVGHMQSVCNACRWKAFKDAFDLKSKVILVYDMPGTRSIIQKNPLIGPVEVLDMSEKNIPFINQKRLNIRNKNYNLKFYSCEIHPDYNNPKPNKLQAMELFRKVYTYEHHERERILEAKSEVLIAHDMMSKHRNIAELLFAFRHENQDYEVVELIYKRHKGSLEDLLKGHIQPKKLKSEGDSRSGLMDNYLWTALVNIVEAVVKVRSGLKSNSTLDIKPANVLVETEDNGDFVTLYLTDFGHIAEAVPRNATIEYAPPGSVNVGAENAATYDVWSMACMLLQVLIFINGHFEKSELEAFNSERQGDFEDAAFWMELDGKHKLREPVERKFTTLAQGKQYQMTEVINKIHDMLSIYPPARGKMEDCLQFFQRASFSRWPAERDFMMCGTEKWQVFYRNTTIPQTLAAKIAVYRDARPTEQHQQGHEQIYLDLDLGGNTPLFDQSAYRSVRFSPAAFWMTAQGDDNRDEQTKDTEIKDIKIGNQRSNDKEAKEMNALWFDSLHKSYTLLFSRTEEYRKFITLMTGQQIIRKSSSRDTDFRFGQCILNDKKQSSYVDGKIQLWKLLSDQDYDKQFERTSSPLASRRRFTYTNRKLKDHTPWKMMFWMRSCSKAREKVCVVVDVGELTWKLSGKPDTPYIAIKQAGFFWDSNVKMRAEIFREEHGRLATENYPFIPIDAAQLQTHLKPKLVSKIEIYFSSVEEKSEFLKCLEDHGFLKQLGLTD